MRVGGKRKIRVSPHLAYGDSYGISSSGLSNNGVGGLFGPFDRFNSNNLFGPDSPDGINYGITTNSDTTGNDNGGLSGQPLVNNTVIFTFSGVGSSFDPSTAISNIVFQYGTDLTETSLVPEPTSLALFASGALVFFAARRRRSR